MGKETVGQVSLVEDKTMQDKDAIAKQATLNFFQFMQQNTDGCMGTTVDAAKSIVMSIMNTIKYECGEEVMHKFCTAFQKDMNQAEAYIMGSDKTEATIDRDGVAAHLKKTK